MASPGPVESERIAKLLLHGMDLASVDFFCSQLDELDVEFGPADVADRSLEIISHQSAELAERFSEIRKQRQAGAQKANMVRSAWYTDAFIAYVAYLHFNPGR